MKAFVGPSAAALLLLALLCGGCAREAPEEPWYERVPVDRPGVRGDVLVSVFGTRSVEAAPSRHVSVFVNGAGSYHMEDNGLRGFLDGRFKWGWNDQGQTHTRVGRRRRGAQYGEWELYRTIQRWDPLPLPHLARVVDASLSITVEVPRDTPRRLLLYEVRKDWFPGTGGTLGNNVSPPKHGEVWWNDLAFGQEAWGLPGVGYASDGDPGGDTGGMPLADALYTPGDSRVVFRSDRLTGYLARRVNEGRHLNFLVKLADYQEDLPGSAVSLYSANQGDSRNLVRRPRLELTWESRAEASSLEQPVFLEYGRIHVLPRMPLDIGRKLAVTFRGDAGYVPPAIEIRGGGPQAADDWSRWPREIPRAWEWCEVRLLAARDPVMLGQSFRSELRDTWILSAPPEEQRIPWTFVSPTGKRYEREAVFVDDFTWRIEFVPDEIGPWQYSWRHEFIDHPYSSAPGSFDVVGGDAKNVLHHLGALASRISKLDERELNEERQLLMVQLMRLERSALSTQTPSTFQAREGIQLREAINEVRASLDESAPDLLPLIPNRYPTWKASQRPRR